MRFDFGKDQWHSSGQFLELGQVEEVTALRGKLLDDLQGEVEFSCKGSKPHIGPLSPGCSLCGQGLWSCLFLNRVCNANCFFCPGNEAPIEAPAYADRIVFDTPEKYSAYVVKLGFRGVSFSGGEPFLTFDRLMAYLRAIGDLDTDIYMWAYTNGAPATKDRLTEVVKAGLDELRYNIADTNYELDVIARAIDVVPRVTVEIPAIPEDEEQLWKVLPKLKEMGVDHLHLHQLMVTGDNAVNLIKRGYTFIPLTTPAVVESELSALKTLRFALDEGIDLPINYCSMVYKDRWQRNEDLLGGALAKTPCEVQTEWGFIRSLWLETPNNSVSSAASQLEEQGVKRDLWELDEDAGRLFFHPSIIDHIDLPDPRFFVSYHKTVMGEQAETSAERKTPGYLDLELSSSHTVGVRRFPLCPPYPVSRDVVVQLARDETPESLDGLENIHTGLFDFSDLQLLNPA